MTVPASANLSNAFAELEQQRRRKKRDTYISNPFAVLYVAITTIIMAYGGLFGFISILVFYVLWLPRVFYKGVFLLRPTRDVVLTLLLPLLAVASTAWSEEKAISLYSSLEYTSLIICTIIMSRTVSIKALVQGVSLGSTLVLIASLINGKHGLDPFSGGYSLVGLFGSKNMVGVFAEIGIFLSVIIFFIRQGIIERMLFSLFPLAICCVSLFLSKSASSVISLAVTFAVVLSAYIITKLPRSSRIFSFWGLTFVTATIIVAGVSAGLQNAVLKAFGKSTTLTGRTHLWDVGVKVGMDRPFLGHGFSAFWVQGHTRAEQLWAEFGIANRTGFHFHNVYVELFVELGIVGVLLIVILMLTNFSKSYFGLLRQGMNLEYAYALGFSTMFIVRSFVELDTIGTFGITGILFFSIIPRLAEDRRRQLSGLKQYKEGKIHA